RRQVGLRVDAQVGGAKPRQRDRVGDVGKLVREAKVGVHSANPAASTSASSPLRPTSCTDAGNPSSASPAGAASAGQPSAFNGNVNRVSSPRISVSTTSAGGGTKASVGVTSRS